VYRGLFAKHKLLFSFQVCMKILLGEDPPKYSAAEYAFFLRGGTVMDRELQPKNPCADWLDEPLWDNITELERHESFRGLIASFDSVPKDWRRWFRSAEPERAALPVGLVLAGRRGVARRGVAPLTSVIERCQGVAVP